MITVRFHCLKSYFRKEYSNGQTKISPLAWLCRKTDLAKRICIKDASVLEMTKMSWKCFFLGKSQKCKCSIDTNHFELDYNANTKAFLNIFYFQLKKQSDHNDVNVLNKPAAP